MGDPYLACALSDLPIDTGDPVRYILICRTGRNDHVAPRSHSWWYPIAPALRATAIYDGHIEFPEEEGFEQSIYATSLHGEIFTGEYEKASWGVGGKFPFKTLVALVETDGVHFSAPKHGLSFLPERLSVNRTVVREDVWQWFLTARGQYYGLDGTETNTPETFKAFLDSHYRELLLAASEHDLYRLYMTGPVAHEAMWRLRDPDFFGLPGLRNTLWELAKTGLDAEHADVERVLTAAAETLFVWTHLSTFHRKWEPSRILYTDKQRAAHFHREMAKLERLFVKQRKAEGR